MPDALARGFRLGRVEVRPSESSLIVEGDAVHIEPKVMQVLLALVSAAPNLVRREDLVAQVWPRGYVTDDALNRCISSLRHALGDDARSPEFILTVPRKGYRLAQVATTDAPASEGLLVLPFQDLSAGREDIVADALTELLIARLSIALSQPVISRTTAMTFKGASREVGSISRQLGVRWLVEGSVMQLGGRVQIVVQLIDGLSDTHRWAETWTREMGDVLTVLNEVSHLVAVQVRSELSAREPCPAPPRALPADLLREYLHGVQLNSKRTHAALRQAMGCFERVLEARPGHAPALSGMAASYFLLAHYGGLPPAEGFEECKRLSHAALELDPGLHEARLHLAATNFFHDWDFALAERRVREALDGNSNLEMAWLVLANLEQVKGRPESAQNCIDRALEIDPLNPGLLMNAGDHFILQRRYAEAIPVLLKAVEIEPAFRPAWLRLSLAHAFGGAPEPARQCLDRARELQGEDGAYYEYSALAAGQSGESALAREAATRLENLQGEQPPVAPWSLARAWAAAGDAERALDHLETALATRSSSMPFLAVTPVFDGLRQNPRIDPIMREAGLVRTATKP